MGGAVTRWLPPPEVFGVDLSDADVAFLAKQFVAESFAFCADDFQDGDSDRAVFQRVVGDAVGVRFCGGFKSDVVGFPPVAAFGFACRCVDECGKAFHVGSFLAPWGRFGLLCSLGLFFPLPPIYHDQRARKVTKKTRNFQKKWKKV